MFISSLAGKMNKDQQFGKDTDVSMLSSLESKLCRKIKFKNFQFGKAFNEPNNSSNSAIDKTVIDLDIIIEKWIAYMWEKTKTKQSSKQQAIEFEDLDIVVNWNKVEINQEEAIFREKLQPNKKIHQQTLFRTYFTNKTDQDQEYSFKTERTTRQSCSFTFIKGFSREKEGSISFKLPYDVVELAGGIKSEQSIECGKDQTNEEEITWGVDSLIKVGPKTKTTAELVINELEMEKEFNVITYLKGSEE